MCRILKLSFSSAPVPDLYSPNRKTGGLGRKSDVRNIWEPEKQAARGIKDDKLILRLPGSGTSNMFNASLESRDMSIDDFDAMLEVDNIVYAPGFKYGDFAEEIIEIYKRQWKSGMCFYACVWQKKARIPAGPVWEKTYEGR